MSEDGVGAVERAALDRARRRIVAQRRECYRQLEDIAELAQLHVARATGDRSTQRLSGALDSGAFADPATVRRWACDAEIVPMVLGARSEPLDVGRLSRTVTDAIRRALNLRDGGCAFPGCTRRPRRCHAHHIHHRIDGGATSLDNLVLLCVFHHQLLHHGHWTVTLVDGRPTSTPPPWVDPDRRSRPGGRPLVPL